MSTTLVCNLCGATTIATASDPPSNWKITRATTSPPWCVCPACLASEPPADEGDCVLQLDSPLTR